MLSAGVTDDIYDQVVSAYKSIHFGPGKLYTYCMDDKSYS
jgi:hypothetical protein